MTDIIVEEEYTPSQNLGFYDRFNMITSHTLKDEPDFKGWTYKEIDMTWYYLGRIKKKEFHEICAIIVDKELLKSAYYESQSSLLSSQLKSFTYKRPTVLGIPNEKESKLDKHFNLAIETALEFAYRVNDNPEFTLYENIPACYNPEYLLGEVLEYRDWYEDARQGKSPYRQVIRLYPVILSIAFMEEQAKAKEKEDLKKFKLYEELIEILKGYVDKGDMQSAVEHIAKYPDLGREWIPEDLIEDTTGFVLTNNERQWIGQLVEKLQVVKKDCSDMPIVMEEIKHFENLIAEEKWEQVLELVSTVETLIEVTEMKIEVQ